MKRYDKIRSELGHERNNYYVMFKGSNKFWKVFKSKKRAEAAAATLRKKGKEVSVGPTAASVSESINEKKQSDSPVHQFIGKSNLRREKLVKVDYKDDGSVELTVKGEKGSRFTSKSDVTALRMADSLFDTWHNSGMRDLVYNNNEKSILGVQKSTHAKYGKIKFTTKKSGDNYTIKVVSESTLDEAKVNIAKKRYSWGTMTTIKKGNSFSVPIHPKDMKTILDIADKKKGAFRDETGDSWSIERRGDLLQFTSRGRTVAVERDDLKESLDLSEYKGSIRYRIRNKLGISPDRKDRDEISKIGTQAAIDNSRERAKTKDKIASEVKKVSSKAASIISKNKNYKEIKFALNKELDDKTREDVASILKKNGLTVNMAKNGLINSIRESLDLSKYKDTLKPLKKEKPSKTKRSTSELIATIALIGKLNKDLKDPKLSATKRKKIEREIKKLNKEVMMKESKTLGEGTWAVPETPEDYKKLAKLLSRPMRVRGKESDKNHPAMKLYGLLGDDELFDDLGELEQGEDARPTIINFLKKNAPQMYKKVKAAGLRESVEQIEEKKSPVNYTLGNKPDKDYLYQIIKNGEPLEGDLYHSLGDAKRVLGNKKKTNKIDKFKIDRVKRNKLAGPKGKIPEEFEQLDELTALEEARAYTQKDWDRWEKIGSGVTDIQKKELTSRLKNLSKYAHKKSKSPLQNVTGKKSKGDWAMSSATADIWIKKLKSKDLSDVGQAYDLGQKLLGNTKKGFFESTEQLDELTDKQRAEIAARKKKREDERAAKKAKAAENKAKREKNKGARGGEGAYDKEDDHVIMQFRKAQDVDGNMDIKFGRNKTGKVSKDDIDAVLSFHDKLSKPDDKRRMRIKLAKGGVAAAKQLAAVYRKTVGK